MDHERFMNIALKEADKGKDTVGDNPMVGAVIVEDGNVVAKAHHVQPGESHAEILALNSLQRNPKPGAFLYVTLEPCSTLGRTGKCTESIINAGITTVVVGAIDPNPDHNGRGIQILIDAGIEVVTGVLEKECTALNPEFNQRMFEEGKKRKD